jgi:hypothetical protein
MNQVSGPAYSGDILYFTRVLLFISFISMGYALSRPQNVDRQHSLSQESTSLQPWQKQVSEKAIKKYAAAQDKKWLRWNEAMFERSS